MKYLRRLNKYVKGYIDSDRMREFIDRYPRLHTELGYVFSSVAIGSLVYLVTYITFDSIIASEEVTKFSQNTLNIGVYMICFLLIAEMLTFSFKFKGGFLFALIYQNIKRILMLTLVVMLVQSSADVIITLYQNDPMLLSQIFAGFLVILIALKLSENKNKYCQAVSTRGISSTTIGVTSIGPSVMTQSDIDHTAVHEAGHALVHALLDELPPSFSASVVPIHSEGSSGRVKSSNGIDNSKSKHQLEWSMMRDLAGFAAESVIYDEGKTGSGEDFKKWEETAKLYFLSGFGSYFYKTPLSSLEQESNTKALQQLKDTTIEKAKMYLANNKNILEALTKELKDKKRLSSEQLQEYLRECSLKGFLPVSLDYQIEDVRIK